MNLGTKIEPCDNTIFERDLYDLMVVIDRIEVDIPLLPFDFERKQAIDSLRSILWRTYELIDREYQKGEADILAKERKEQ